MYDDMYDDIVFYKYKMFRNLININIVLLIK